MTVRSGITSASICAALLACAPAEGQTTEAKACSVEKHPVAINPDIVECHAKLAPLPVIPDVIDEHNALFVREQGDWLLRELQRPERCGKGAKLRTGQACAIIIYTLDTAHRQAGLPWTYIVKIYRVSHPKKIRDTVVFAMNHNSSERRLGGSNEDVWRLLADVRVQERCQPRVDTRIGTGVSAAGETALGRPDSCRHMATDMRYRPKLVLGRDNADRVLSAHSIREHFHVPAQVVNDAAAVLKELRYGN